MNQDHADAVKLYAEYFGHCDRVSHAQMKSIDPEGMDLVITQGEEPSLLVRIPFDHRLQDSEDAHHTLIAMLKQARSSQA
jgi:putative heme iron utilization protein